MHLVGFTSLFSSIAIFFAGIWMFFKAPDVHIRNSFFRMCLVAAAMMLLNTLTTTATTPETIIAYNNAIALFTIFTPVVVFDFIVHTLYIEEAKRWLIVAYTMAVILATLIPFNLMWSGKILTAPVSSIPEAGIGTMASLSFTLGMLALGILVLLVYALDKRNSPLMRKNAWTILAATIVGSMAGIDLFRYLGSQISPVAHLWMLAWILVYMFAIAKSKFLVINPETAAEDIIGSMPMGALLINSQGIIQTANDYAVQMVGVREDVLLGTNINTYINKIEAKKLKGINRPFNLDAELSQNSGRSLPVIITVKPVIKAGDALGFVVFFVDTSEMKKQAYIIAAQQKKIDAAGQEMDKIQNMLVKRELRMAKLKKQLKNTEAIQEFSA